MEIAAKLKMVLKNSSFVANNEIVLNVNASRLNKVIPCVNWSQPVQLAEFNLQCGMVRVVYSHTRRQN